MHRRRHVRYRICWFSLWKYSVVARGGKRRRQWRNIEDDASYFPSIYSRYNSLRFFTLSLTARTRPSLPAAFLVRCSSLFVVFIDKGGNKGIEGEMRPFDTKATRCASTRVVMSSLHPFVPYSIPPPVCATAWTRRYLRSHRGSRGSRGSRGVPWAFMQFNSTWLFADVTYVRGILFEIPKCLKTENV